MNYKKIINEATLRKMYVEDQISAVQIAEKLSVSSAAIYNALVRFNIPRRTLDQASRKRWKHTWETDWSSLAEDYRSGETLEEISIKVGCTISVVANHFRALGITIRPKASETPLHPNSRNRMEFDEERFKHLNLVEGKTLPEISAVLPEHPSVQVLSMRAKARGWEIKRNYPGKRRSEYPNYQILKRKIAEAIKMKDCIICHEARGLKLCHIQGREFGGPMDPGNFVALCPTHHEAFDWGELLKPELKKIKPCLDAAAKLGFIHQDKIRPHLRKRA